MIQAKIIADSTNEFGNRLTTMVVTMPRIILAELNTHRMFSRNSASSRAIPFEKMVKSVQENPFIPIAWQKDHKGMQGTEYFTDETIFGYSGIEFESDLLVQKPISHLTASKETWLAARDTAVAQAKQLSEIGVTKQLCNRLLEPFMWHTVIITASEYENFFELRCPQYQHQEGTIFRSWKDLVKDAFNSGGSRDWVDGLENYTTLERLQHNKGQAEIHMMALAEAMYDAYQESTAKLLKAGEWHIPFGDNIDQKFLGDLLIKLNETDKITERGYKSILDWEDLQKVKIAVARCARVSYTTVGEEDKIPNYENDIKLHDNLLKSKHYSPFEHCAKCMDAHEYHGHHLTQGDGNPFNPKNKEEFGVSYNLRGFIQYREMLS